MTAQTSASNGTAAQPKTTLTPTTVRTGNGVAEAILAHLRAGETAGTTIRLEDGTVGILAVVRPLTAQEAEIKRAEAPTSGYHTLANVGRRDLQRRVNLDTSDSYVRAFWPECSYLDMTLQVRAFDQSDDGKATRLKAEVRALVARECGAIEREYEASIKKLPLALRAEATRKAEPEIARQKRLAEDRIRAEAGLAPLYPVEQHSPAQSVEVVPLAPEVDPAFVAVDPMFLPKTREDVVRELLGLVNAADPASRITREEATKRLYAWDAQMAARG